MYRATQVAALSIRYSISRLSTAVNTISHGRKDETHPAPLKSFHEIPGPKGLPLLGTLLEYLRPGGLKFEKLFEVLDARSKQYGPIFKETIAGTTCVTISDLGEYVKIIKIDGKYPKRMMVEPLRYYRDIHGMDQGVVNSEGKEWLDRRQIVAPKLLKPLEILNYVDRNDEVVEDFLKKLKTNFGSHRPSPLDKTNGFIVSDLENNLCLWALEAAASAVFGSRIGCLNVPLSEDVEEFVNNIHGCFDGLQILLYGFPTYKYFPTKTWRKFSESYDGVVKKGQQLMEENKRRLECNAQTEAHDILTHLLSNSTLDSETTNLTCIDVLGGGVDTTSYGALWVMYCLARNKDAQEKLHKEAVSLLPNPDDKITKDVFENLKYVRACVKEAFRIYPVSVFVTRICADDVEVGGYALPAGTLCQSNNFTMGRDEKYFPDPLSFKPERWLRESNPDPILSTFSTLIFGHGSRMCLGRRLAEMEIYILITKIFRNYKVEFAGESEVQPVMRLIMIPDRPISLKITPRY